MKVIAQHPMLNIFPAYEMHTPSYWSNNNTADVQEKLGFLKFVSNIR